ncbi:hypothetical protein [Piscirickettsia litoralis]|nr:hypothetical protein [Piscirickettsia litoralis]
MPGVEVETIDFDGDHLHMVMVVPLKYSIVSCNAAIKRPIGVV